MKQPHSLKDNLDKSVELGCKEAIIEKGRLMKTGYLEMSDSEIGEMKSRLRKLLNTQTLTAEERKKVEEYEKFEKKDVEAF